MTPEQRETLKLMVERGGTQCWRMCGDFEPHEMDALRAALAPAPTCGTWQPIETAPQDGHVIIGLTWDRVVRVVYWGRGSKSWRHAADGWCSGDAPTMTHWMPLPDPPTEPTR